MVRRREITVAPNVTEHHANQVKMILALNQEVESNNAGGITAMGCGNGRYGNSINSDVIQNSTSTSSTDEKCWRKNSGSCSGNNDKEIEIHHK